MNSTSVEEKKVKRGENSQRFYGCAYTMRMKGETNVRKADGEIDEMYVCEGCISGEETHAILPRDDKRKI